MKFVSICAVFLIVNIAITMAASIPADDSKDSEIATEYTNGDKIVDSNDSEILDDDFEIGDMSVQLSRSGLLAPPKKWPNAKVFYKISSKFNSTHVNAILSAMHQIQNATCIRFFKAGKTNTKYIDIVPAIGLCRSLTGYRGNIQKLELSKPEDGKNCFLNGFILHEFMHALGFFHQHMAYNRDDYVKVLWENIIETKEYNFLKLPKKVAPDFGYTYDFETIMQYAPKSFSSNGLATLIPLDPSLKLYQRMALSKKDIGKMNAMYKCSAKRAI